MAGPRNNFVLFAGLLLLNSSSAKARASGVPIVNIEQGAISGTTLRSESGFDFQSFVGIPYGKAERFEKAKPADPWEGTYKADKTVFCAQKNVFAPDTVFEIEDCLVVNVHTRGLSGDGNVSGEPRPVMVWIPGGAFAQGSGDIGPEFFMDEELVLITVNYRLGPLGFLSMGDDVLPGNLGLWDQRLALEWVEANAAAFGGDHNKVTLFGNSAGGMSVVYHLLSQQSTGLFHGAIVQSGPISGTFTKLDKNPVYYARSFAARLGCDPDANSTDIKSCLKEADITPILEHTKMFTEYKVGHLTLPFPWKPIIDDFATDSFLPEDPEDLIEKGQIQQVPIIYGFTKDEGVSMMDDFHTEAEASFKKLETNWNNAIALFVNGREEDEMTDADTELSKDVLAEIFSNKYPSKDHGFQELQDLLGNAFFNAVGTLTGRKIASKVSTPVYQYQFSHQSSLSFTDFTIEPTWKFPTRIIWRKLISAEWDPFHNEYGVSHNDDVFTMFKTNQLTFLGLDWSFSKADLQVKDHFVRLWTNFAKYGDPTPVGDQKTPVKWQRIGSSDPQYLDIAEELSMRSDSASAEQWMTWFKDMWTQFPPRQCFDSSRTWNDTSLYQDSAADAQ